MILGDAVNAHHVTDFLFDGLSGFIGAVVGAFGALASVWYSARLLGRTARRQEVDRVRVQVYMKLINLRSIYEACAVAQSHHRPPGRRILHQMRVAAWEIADTIRLADDIPETRQIVRLIFLNTLTWRERDELASSIINSMSSAINPRYIQFVREIDQENAKHPEAILNGINTVPETED